MYKLLALSLLVGSFSYADEHQDEFTVGVQYYAFGQGFQLRASQKNADFFCLYQGYDYAKSFERIEVQRRGIIGDAIPRLGDQLIGHNFSATSDASEPVLSKVVCVKKLNR